MGDWRLISRMICRAAVGGLVLVLCLNATACRSPAHNARVQDLRGLAHEIISSEKDFLGSAGVVQHIVCTVGDLPPHIQAEQGTYYWQGRSWMLVFDFKGLGSQQLPFRVHREPAGRCGVRIARLAYADPRGVDKLLTLYTDRKTTTERGPTFLSRLGSFNSRGFVTTRLPKMAEEVVRAEAAFWDDPIVVSGLVRTIRTEKPETNEPPPPPRYTLKRFQQLDGTPTTFTWKREQCSVKIELAYVAGTAGKGGKAGAPLSKVYIHRATLALFEKEPLQRRLILLRNRRTLAEFGDTILAELPPTDRPAKRD